MTFQKILDKFRKSAYSERDKGDKFERLMQATPISSSLTKKRPQTERFFLIFIFLVTFYRKQL